MLDLREEDIVNILWYFLDNYNRGNKRVLISKFNKDFEEELKGFTFKNNLDDLINNNYVLNDSNKYYRFAYGVDFLRKFFMHYETSKPMKLMFGDSEFDEMLRNGYTKRDLEVYKTTLDDLMNNELFCGFDGFKIKEDEENGLIPSSNFEAFREELKKKLSPKLAQEMIDKKSICESVLITDDLVNEIQINPNPIDKLSFVFRLAEEMYKGDIFHAKLIYIFVRASASIPLFDKIGAFISELNRLTKELGLPDCMVRKYREISAFVIKGGNSLIKTLSTINDEYEVLEYFIRYKIENLLFNLEIDLTLEETTEIAAKMIMKASYKLSKTMNRKLAEKIRNHYLSEMTIQECNSIDEINDECMRLVRLMDNVIDYLTNISDDNYKKVINEMFIN